MRNLGMTLVAFVLVAGSAFAAGPNDPYRATTEQQSSLSIATSPLTPTPEMWFYQQYINQYQDPHTMVRKNAELAAAHRRGRIEARRWYGFSNMRPVANIDFVHTPAPSPRWSSSSVNYPFRWGMAPTGILVLRRQPLRTY